MPKMSAKCSKYEHLETVRRYYSHYNHKGQGGQSAATARHL